MARPVLGHRQTVLQKGLYHFNSHRTAVHHQPGRQYDGHHYGGKAGRGVNFRFKPRKPILQYLCLPLHGHQRGGCGAFQSVAVCIETKIID